MKLLGVSLDGNPIYIVTEYCGKVNKMTKVLCLSIQVTAHLPMITEQDSTCDFQKDKLRGHLLKIC